MSKIEELEEKDNFDFRERILQEFLSQNNKVVTDAILSMDRDNIIYVLSPMKEALKDGGNLSESFSACMNDLEKQVEPLCDALNVTGTELISPLANLAKQIYQRSEELKVGVSKPSDDNFVEIFASFFNGIQTQRVTTDTTTLDELAVHEEVSIISDDELSRELALADLVD
jgi:hypothetical protein